MTVCWGRVRRYTTPVLLVVVAPFVLLVLGFTILLLKIAPIPETAPRPMQIPYTSAEAEVV